MLNIAVFVSGNGSNLENILAANIANCQIKLVVSSNKKAYALARAANHGIDTMILDNEFDESSLLKDLAARKITLIVLAGFMKILNLSFIENFNGQIINIHPSLLPAYGGQGMYGLKVHEAVLKAGDKYSGATVHQVTSIVDGGEIIEQIKVPVFPADTPQSLQRRIQEDGEKILLPAVIKKMCERSLSK